MCSNLKTRHLKTKVFEQCILPTLTVTETFLKALIVTQRKMEWPMLGVRLQEKITLRNKIRVTNVVQRVAILKWQWAGFPTNAPCW